MIESDLYVSEDSSDEDESSDSVEIITDGMQSSRLDPKGANVASQRGVGLSGDMSQNARPFRFQFAVPKSQIAKMATISWDADREYHNSMFASTGRSSDRTNHVHMEEIRTTPLFSAEVLAETLRPQTDPALSGQLLPEYGLLAKILDVFGGNHDSELLSPGQGPPTNAVPEDDRLMVNMNAPWSAFICGSQGSGKSHTLSCMLENALVPSQLGKLPHPLAGMVFHYDKFTGFSSTQVCEAAYLASSGIPVRVLVSPSNRWRMKQVYRNLPGFPENATRPTVIPLLLYEKQLNVERMMKLMAVDGKDGKMALYMESVCRILRSMAMKNQGAPGIDFAEFTRRLELEKLNDGQKAMLNTRLELLKSLMYLSPRQGADAAHQEKRDFQNTKKGREQERKWLGEEDDLERARMGGSDTEIWSFEPGSLTIIDLSCPFVDESAACAMFNICLALFLEDRTQAGRIVALDEAHKFMTATDSSSQFTESLLSVIRQQRHLATRVIIATQEPTISPALLDLSSMTIVHRFISPHWLTTLKSHLASISNEGDPSKRDVDGIFARIVDLDAGQAFLFSPSAMLHVESGHNNASTLKMQKLGTRYAKIEVRMRLTTDGGRSILAT